MKKHIQGKYSISQQTNVNYSRRNISYHCDYAKTPIMGSNLSYFASSFHQKIEHENQLSVSTIDLLNLEREVQVHIKLIKYHKNK
jgi:hypothetical protein